MSDLGRRRDKYRGRGVGFLPGLVLYGYGWFRLPSRVSESVGRIVNSVLRTGPDRLGGGCESRRPTSGRGGRGTDKNTLTLVGSTSVRV